MGLISTLFKSLTTLLICFVVLTQSRYVAIEDEQDVYLDEIARELEAELNTTKSLFYEQAVLTEQVAKKFVGAQLKENLFIVCLI